MGELLITTTLRLAHCVKLIEQALGCDGSVTLIDPGFQELQRELVITHNQQRHPAVGIVNLISDQD
jgi:hypothetical protein